MKIFKTLILSVITAGILSGMPVCAEDLSDEGTIHRPSYMDEAIASSEDNLNSDTFVDDSTDNSLGYYTIMGNTTVTTQKMIDLYNNQGVTYPGDILDEGGAGTIDEFCQIIAEEASYEGVRAEVVYAQSMLETGWLTYTGDSKAAQFNFSGLGTTGGGVAGNSYPDVRTGLRAQVQHLKAYASDQELNLDLVDDRFDLVTRLSAPYVEWLGVQENPYGAGWATGANYGAKLLNIIAQLKS